MRKMIVSLTGSDEADRDVGASETQLSMMLSRNLSQGSLAMEEHRLAHAF